MVVGGYNRPLKFFVEQIEELTKLIKKLINEDGSSNMSFERYVKIQEQLGLEVDPSRMPPSLDDLPHQAQVAFFMHGLLSDKFDSNAGVYIGKDWNPLKFFFDEFDVQDRNYVLQIMILIDRSVGEKINNKIKSDRDKQERASRAKSMVKR